MPLSLKRCIRPLPEAIFNRIRVRVGLIAKPLSAVLPEPIDTRVELVPEQLQPIDHMHSLGVPVLILGGTADQRTRIEETRALFALAQPPKELWEIPGASMKIFIALQRSSMSVVY